MAGELPYAVLSPFPPPEKKRKTIPVRVSPEFVEFFCLFCFLGLHLQHMEVPRVGVKSELQLPAYTTATETPDLSHVCDLHHSSSQPDP